MVERLARLVADAPRVPGVCGAIIVDAAGVERVALRADEAFPAASVIKVPLVMALYAEAARGRLDLGEPVSLGERVDGTGVLRDLRDVGALSLRDLAALAITVSDNTATNRLIERLGLAAVERWLAAWGCTGTRLRRRMYDTAAAARGLENIAVPREIAALLRRLHDGGLEDRATSDAVLALLERCQDVSLLARDLPDGARLAHKTGSLPRARADVGIVYGAAPVVVCAFVRDTGDVARAAAWIGDAGRAAYELAGRA